MRRPYPPAAGRARERVALHSSPSSQAAAQETVVRAEPLIWLRSLSAVALRLVNKHTHEARHGGATATSSELRWRSSYGWFPKASVQATAEAGVSPPDAGTVQQFPLTRTRTQPFVPDGGIRVNRVAL